MFPERRAALAGAAARPIALNSVCPTPPATTRTVCTAPAVVPSVKVVWASPLASVVAFVVLTEPPPPVTLKIRSMFATELLPASVMRTTRGSGSVVATSADWLSPDARVITLPT